ncbi:MAG: hypothetical protein HXY24_16905, partial [Rubrivivax sp.]|nr:hypothetical protein [Rubrivivax sp.]
MAPAQAKILAVFAVSIVCLSAGNVLLAAGTQRFGQLDPHGAAATLRALGIAWQFPAGIALMIAQFVGMLALFGWGLPVSVVVPVFGLNYAVTALLGAVWLR